MCQNDGMNSPQDKPPVLQQGASGNEDLSLSRAFVVKVALDVPLDQLFDYLCDQTHVQIGQRVSVPFANRMLTGVVIARSAQSDFPPEKLKFVSALHEDAGGYEGGKLLDSDTLSLIHFCADYYHFPFGQALLSILPNRLRQGRPLNTITQSRYRLTKLGLALSEQEIPKRQIVQRKLWQAFQTHGALHQQRLAEISASWQKAVVAMQANGWVESERVLTSPQPQVIFAEAAPLLNQEQAHAVHAVCASSGMFRPFLLHGITGSGKTEVYMRILEQLLADGGQALVLVPEINLTPQLEARFKKRFSDWLLVTLHSNLNDSERLRNWLLAQTGQARIIIGTRLSVFTPLPKLALVIVDEEHDSSFKQQEGMRYHARDIAMVRSQRAKVPIVLGSATPALETWRHAQTGKYTHLSLNLRAVPQAHLPAIRCINLQHEQHTQGLSVTLIDAIRQRLKRGEQSLLFLNRRGYAPVLLCQSCLWMAPCMRCSSRLVVHLRQKRLRCHHCGYEQKIVAQCPSCGNPDLQAIGQGTQRLEETLRAIFPQARIQRVDRDTVQRKAALDEILEAVHAGAIDILIGTQMLSKGHDFPNLTLVGVLDSDNALFSADFRAEERLFAQLMQVAGRAGRAEKPGEVLIQTRLPEHKLFQYLMRQDYPDFAKQLLDERLLTEFPPFRYLAVIHAEAKHYSKVSRFLELVATMAREYTSLVSTYDPVRPQMEKVNGLERARVLMQAEQRGALQSLLTALVPILRKHPLSQGVRWHVDVDPLEI